MSPLVRLIMHRLASGRVRPTPEVLAALKTLNARSLYRGPKKVCPASSNPAEPDETPPNHNRDS